MRNCVICGIPFSTNKKGCGRKKTCGKECSKKHHNNLVVNYKKENESWLRPLLLDSSRRYKKANRSKMNEDNKKWVQANPEKHKKLRNKATLKYRYNITPEEYIKKYKEQDGLCDICKKPERAVEKRTGQIKNLAVDHCHTSGAIRGLLCTTCNIGIGNLKDSIENLKNAIAYLEKYNET